ncbi:lysophospholipid acyltransferase 7-like [Octodon degus]|uniref:Leukocyte receptor cluster member 4 n=1 Tax=Octodon degus TaxID=10160 RepID=A0A6P6DWF3_OCTDE|nr:lysophospholipid acyltransferase 7-like [Octodon degus]
MTPEEWTFLVILLISIPIGFLFKKAGPGLKRWGAAAVGLGLTVFTCGPHTLHSLITVLGTWALIQAQPCSCRSLALLWIFSYTLFFHTLSLLGLQTNMHTYIIQLLVTLKLVSLVRDIPDQHLAQRKEMAAGFSKPPALGLLPDVPSLMETLSYSYCYVGIMTVVLIALLAMGRPPAVRDGVPQPLPGQNGALVSVRAGTGADVGGAWLSCMSVPALIPTPSLEKAAALEYDYETIRNFDCYNGEFCISIREGMRYWNMTVQWWLAQYIYKSVPTRSYVVRSVWTLLLSAYWHGLHPGYYLSFFTMPLCLAAEGCLESALSGRLSPRGRKVWCCVHWFLKMRAYEYMFMSFVLLSVDNTFRYWSSVYFCIHVLALACLGIGLALGGHCPREQKMASQAPSLTPEKFRGE